SDLLLVLGARLGEMPTSGYKHLRIPNPVQPMIHVHPDPNELGKVYRPESAINATPKSLLNKLAKKRPGKINWTAWTEQGRSNYEAWSTPQETPGAVKLEEVVRHLRDTLPENAIITNGAGNYAGWLNRYFRFPVYGSHLAPTSGSMGYGLPAAIAAKLERPEAPVICFAGDGCFQMTNQEFGTAIQYGANVIVIICNNSQYGTIRMHQEKTYPGRVSGTQIVNPDFAALAKAYGGYGELVEKTSDFPDAFNRARESGKPAILELTMSPEAISPAATLSDLG
ncbi:MAG: thiamine pyrophosphate-dependent enzyme, partial [Methyloligellaceae bacterium]